MTIQQKAIEQLERVSRHLATIGEKEDYTEIAIQALEQEPILDKINAEIQKLRGCSCGCSDGIIDNVEDISDKYKAEMESEEKKKKKGISCSN